MEISIAKAGIDHQQSANVVTNIEFFRKTHAAVELYKALQAVSGQ
jgi:hypothetical protein